MQYVQEYEGSASPGSTSQKPGVHVAYVHNSQVINEDKGGWLAKASLADTSKKRTSIDLHTHTLWVVL